MGLRSPALLLTGLVPLVAAALLLPPAGVAEARAPVSCHGEVATIVGTHGDDDLRGTPGRDVIAALRGDDRVRGGGGPDVLCGGRGADHLTGGRGDDRVHGDRDRVTDGLVRGDALTGGPGDDLLDAGYDPRGRRLAGLRDSISWEDADRAVRVDLTHGTATGQGHDRVRLVRGEVHLTAYDDRFVGTRHREVVHAYDGDDHLALRGGPDEAWLDTGEDDGDDRARGGSGADQIVGLGGSDRLRGAGGRDHLALRDPGGSKRAWGGSGRDVIEAALDETPGHYLDGAERLLVSVFVPDGTALVLDLEEQTLRIGETPGRIFSRVPPFIHLLDGRWEVLGSGGADQVLVGAPSTFRGRAGDDSFGGSDGDDTFDGGAGSDTYLADPGGTNTCIDVEHDPGAVCAAP